MTDLTKQESGVATGLDSSPAPPEPAPSGEQEQEPATIVRRRTTHDLIQWICWGAWNMETGKGARLMKVCIALLGFVALASWLNLHHHGFSNKEAMEAAQLGRHIAAHKGYVTYSIRPSVIGLLQQADPAHATEVLERPVPDLSIAPGYPLVLAVLMKVLPVNFAVNRASIWSYQPELLIVLFNEALFLASIFLLFHIAGRLFDSRVAWLSAIAFGASQTLWMFSISGLSTMWVLALFLATVWCLIKMEERDANETDCRLLPSILLASAAGILLGMGELSRYAFGWLVVPAVLFARFFLKRSATKLAAVLLASFVVVTTPWIVRNLMISKTAFGSAGYALLENTRPTEADRLERCVNPDAAGLAYLTPRDVARKFVSNEAEILRKSLPTLGGTWIWPFFLCGLLIPFRRDAPRKIRWFLVWNLALLAIVQALGETHLSAESPEINSENLLVLLAPLVATFGAAFFFTLLDQTVFQSAPARSAAVWLFGAVLCAPLLLGLPNQLSQTVTGWLPIRVQTTAAMMKPNEIMMSDIPWAVAWFGDRPCLWLTVDDAMAFQQLNKLKTINALYLTEETGERPFLSQMMYSWRDWPHFFLKSLPPMGILQGRVPATVPLTNALPEYVPNQMFLSDVVRWKTSK
jgi:hypothetical protein